MKQIKNIVFDFGGVVIGLDREQAVKAFERIGVREADSLLGKYHQQGIFQEVENGDHHNDHQDGGHAAGSSAAGGGRISDFKHGTDLLLSQYDGIIQNLHDFGKPFSIFYNYFKSGKPVFRYIPDGTPRTVHCPVHPECIGPACCKNTDYALPPAACQAFPPPQTSGAHRHG